jgi:hypothetical protein
VDDHYRDRDNYPAMTIGEAEKATGDTLKEAINSLLKMEAKSMIDNYAMPNYEFYRQIDIISVHKVIKDVHLEFDRIPAFKKMVDDRKKEIIIDIEKLKNLQKEDKINKERTMLKELKEKYE